MKKLLIMFLALLMILSLTACGDKTPDPVETTKAPPVNSATNGASEIKTTFFDVSLSDDWIIIEDEAEDDEDGSTAVLQVLDPDDNQYYLIEAEIEVDIEEPYDFREELVEYGFDQYGYKVENAYETFNIGGVDLLRHDDGYETIIYFNRVEGANASVYVKFDAVDINDSHIDALLKGITFKLQDIGNVDGPWAWDGEKFSADGADVTAGAFTLSTQFVPFEGPVTTFETFDHSVAAVGDRIYMLIDGELNVCHYDGNVLAFVDKIDLPDDDYEHIEATSDGTLWLSGGMNDALRIKDGKTVATYEDIDDLAIHPSGEWGVEYFVSNECSIVTFSDTSFTAEPVIFKEADSIMHLTVDENNIYVCASAADESGHKVFIYNKEGKLQKTLCDADGEGLGSVTYITQTNNGYIGFDGNMRDVLLWDNEGTFIEEISDSALFSTNYPWFCDSTVLSDGSILTIMTDERQDRSATELVAFIVKGF